MGRIRTIKPEFPQSESIGRLSRDARLLFIQLWTIVDDSGRTRGSSRMLASLLYPYDEDARELIEGWLTELEKNDMVTRYEYEGQSYLQVDNWLKHQKIDRPTASRLPSFDESSREIASPRREIDDGPWTVDRGPVSVPSTETSADLSVLARCLSEELGIFDLREQEAVHRFLKAKGNGNAAELIEHVKARWKEYQEAIPRLAYSNGSAHKWLMSGKWDNPQAWPWVQTKQSQRDKQWDDFMNGGTEQ